MSRVFAVAGDFLESNPAAGCFAALPAGGATFCAWMKVASLATLYHALTVGTSANSQQRFTLQVSAAAAVGAQEFDATSSTGTSSTAIPDTTGWHLGVCTFNSHSDRHGYVDGTGRGGNSVLKAATVTPYTRISGSPVAGGPFIGKMAHAAIWNGVLTDSEILQLMSYRPYKIRPDDLLEYWPMTGNQPFEPSYGSAGTLLTVNGTTFDGADNPSFPLDLDQPIEGTDYF